MANWSVSTVAQLKSAISKAANGDTIQVKAGTYHITEPGGILVTKSLTIVGQGGRANFEADVPVEKGIFTIKSTVASVTFSNIGFHDAANKDDNGAGIRHQGGDLNVTNCLFDNNENGILGIASAGREGDVRIVGSTFLNSGAGDGFSHGIYVKSDSLLVQGSTFRGTDTGHHIKSLANDTVIRGNLLDDGAGSASRAVDVTGGGDLLVEGNRMIKSAQADNNTFIYYAANRADAGEGAGDVLIRNNEAISHKSNGVFFQNATQQVALVLDNEATSIAPVRFIKGPAAQSGNVLDGKLLPASGDLPEAVNTAPLAQDGSAAGSEDTALHGTLAATDADGDALTYALAANGGPAHGSVTVTADGAFTYVPHANFSGHDAFAYTVKDAHGALAAAQVAVVVAAVADGPTLDVADAVLGGAGKGVGLTGTARADVLAGGSGDDVLHGLAGNDALHGDGAAGADAAPDALGTALDIAAALQDLDGSETLRITVVGLPAGAALSAGTAGAGGTWTLEPGDLAGLTLSLPGGLAAPLALQVSAIATDGGASATSSAVLTVTPGEAAAGDDILVGGAGRDTMHGGAGDDTFLVAGTGDGFDVFAGGAGQDRILGGAGDDTIGIYRSFNPASSVELIDGGGGTNVLRGTDSADTLDFSATGLARIARLEGGGGKDVIRGSAGADVILGQSGDDTLTGNAGGDTFCFAPGSGRDVVTDFAPGDVLRFEGQALAGVSVTRDGSAAVIRFDDGAGQVTLRDVDPADLGYTAVAGAEGPAVVVRLEEGTV